MFGDDANKYVTGSIKGGVNTFYKKIYLVHSRLKNHFMLLDEKNHIMSCSFWKQPKIIYVRTEILKGLW